METARRAETEIFLPLSSRRMPGARLSTGTPLMAKTGHRLSPV